VLALGENGKVGAQAQAEHATEYVGQPGHDDHVGVAERGQARRQGKSHHQALEEAKDGVPDDEVVVVEALGDLGALGGRRDRSRDRQPRAEERVARYLQRRAAGLARRRDEAGTEERRELGSGRTHGDVC
jgi:hypothetical protein